MCNQNNSVTKIALAFPVDCLLPFPVAIEELHASSDKAGRAKEFISHQVVLARSESPTELQSNHCQFWQRANCWPTHFPESWGVTRARCSRWLLPTLFAYSCAKEWFCLTRLEPQQRAAVTPGTCAALYDILNYSTERIDIPTWHRNSACTPSNSDYDNVCLPSTHAFRAQQSINVMYVRSQEVSLLSL